MKNLIYLAVIILIISGIVFPQEEMKLPPPVDNAFLKACEGHWVSEPYDFFGMKWIDEITLKWTLNGQYLMLTGTSKAENGFSFNSVSYMTADKEGNLNSWGFDDWGGKSIGVFTGKIEGMSCTMEGGNDFMKGKVTMNLEGNTMNQNGSYTFQDFASGKEVTQEFSIIYKKK